MVQQRAQGTRIILLATLYMIQTIIVVAEGQEDVQCTFFHIQESCSN